MLKLKELFYAINKVMSLRPDLHKFEVSKDEGISHKISTVRSGKDDKMDNITNRQENYLTQLVVSMLDGKRQSRAKMLKDKRFKHLQKEKESLGKVGDLWTLQESWS